MPGPCPWCLVLQNLKERKSQQPACGRRRERPRFSWQSSWPPLLTQTLGRKKEKSTWESNGNWSHTVELKGRRWQRLLCRGRMKKAFILSLPERPRLGSMRSWPRTFRRDSGILPFGRRWSPSLEKKRHWNFSNNASLKSRNEGADPPPAPDWWHTGLLRTFYFRGARRWGSRWMAISALLKRTDPDW